MGRVLALVAGALVFFIAALGLAVYFTRDEDNLQAVAKLLDVELLERDVGEALDRGALAAGGDDHGGAQRLADLQLRLAARGEPRRNGLAHGRHRELELARRARRPSASP